MILPYFDYEDMIYMGGSKTLLTKLQRLQNKALKICLNVENRHTTSDLHNQTKSVTLVTRRESHLKLMTFNYSRETNYIYKAAKNDAHIIAHNRSTVASYDRSVKSLAAHIWNEQSGTTRNIKSIEAYRKHIQKTK